MTKRDLALWTAILAGPVVWLLSFQANFTLAPWACDFKSKGALITVTILALVLVACSGLLAWREWSALGKVPPDDAPGVMGRTRVMALAGVLLSSLFFIVVLAQSIPNWIIGACE